MFCKEKLNLDVPTTAIDYCHRLFAKEGQQKPIIVKFISRYTKKLVYSKKKMLKGSKVVIKEDLTRANQNLLKEASKRRDRLGRGGGVCLYVRSGLRPKLLGSNDSFEQLWILCNDSFEQLWITGSKTRYIPEALLLPDDINNYFLDSLPLLTVGVIYKPPNADYKAFIDSLEESLSFYGSSSDGVVCLGDVNINLLNLAGPATLYFNDMLSSFDLRQVIDEPTRITENSSSLIDVLLQVEDFPGSDHDLVFCSLDLHLGIVLLLKLYVIFVTSTMRNYRTI
ncbi:hypothetical protein QE152_g14131 [Popillia japonica]|uniref:Endonuclease/exonuclease/phosphatase domain-containing protein n=1 Tax=Popillia japonica TaxID=7064 RepID=A0AAW1L7P6_POPJA